MSQFVEKVKGSKSPDDIDPGMMDANLGVTAGVESVYIEETGTSLALFHRTLDLCATGSRG